MLPPCIHEVSLFRLQCCWAILFSFLLHLCHPEYFFVKIHFFIFDDLEQVYGLFFHLSHPEDVWFYSLHELGVGVLLLHACLLCLGELINFGNLFFQGLPLILNKFENSLIFRHLGYFWWISAQIDFTYSRIYRAFSASSLQVAWLFYPQDGQDFYASEVISETFACPLHGVCYGKVALIP